MPSRCCSNDSRSPVSAAPAEGAAPTSDARLPSARFPSARSAASRSPTRGEDMFRRFSRTLAAGVVTVSIAALATACSSDDDGGSADGLTDVTLQLQWLPQAQFAGYYAAA